MNSRKAVNITAHLPAILVAGALALGAGIIISRLVSSGEEGESASLKIPELSRLALSGRAAFDANCAKCHGANAAGSRKGPPLVHDIYNPGHHGDKAFLLAAKQGTRQHHWPFGDMPPQPQVSDRELTAIVRYVRELQEANGIFYRAHTM